jgi:hypothetical protein
MTQKYFKGDLVQVGKMPDYMSHFCGECQAIVMHTYKEMYGGEKRNEKDYCLYLLGKEKGEHSWYEENQLTFIEANRFDLLPKNHVDRKVWEAKQARELDNLNKEAEKNGEEL